jgi:hypothetical protein
VSEKNTIRNKLLESFPLFRSSLSYLNFGRQILAVKILFDKILLVFSLFFVRANTMDNFIDNATVAELRAAVKDICGEKPNSTRQGLVTQIERFATSHPDVKWPVPEGRPRKPSRAASRRTGEKDDESDDSSVDVTGDSESETGDVDVVDPDELQDTYLLDDAVFRRLPSSPWDFNWDPANKKRVLNDLFPVPDNFDLKIPVTNHDAARIFQPESATADKMLRFAQQLTTDSLRVALWIYNDAIFKRFRKSDDAHKQHVTDLFVLVKTHMHTLSLLNDERRKLLDVRRQDGSSLVSDQEAKDFVRNRSATAKSSQKSRKPTGRPIRRDRYAYSSKGGRQSRSKSSSSSAGSMHDKPGKGDK